MKKRTRSSGGLIAAATCLIALAANAHGEPHETAIEEIVVVGSLIKRQAVYEGRAPVQTLNAEQFESAGAAQLVDVLPNLTANTGSNLATEQNYLQGVSQFSLRGVGLSSTLTLINGRRAGIAPVSNDVGQSFFDINSLPVLLIDRVEVLRDGASATYGSQAVAGVANIVTRKPFTGIEVAGGYRNARSTAYDLGFASGIEFTRGHISLFGSWLDQDENFRTDFDWLIPRAIDPDGDGNIVEGSFDSGRGSPGSFRRAAASPDGTYAPFRIGSIDAPRVPDADCRTAGGYPHGTLCRMDFSDQRTMVAAEQRAQFFATGEFDLTHALTLSSELGFSRNEIIDRVGNMPLFAGNVDPTNEFFVPANHPFNFWTDANNDGQLTYIDPVNWIPGRHEAVPLGYFGRPLGAEAAGDNAGDESRQFENLRVLVGFESDLPGGWIAEGHVLRARSDLSVNSERHWVATEFARAIAEGHWNPFGTRLTAPDLLTPKTVEGDGLRPSLLGKRAANDSETLRRFEGMRTERAKSQQDVAELVASGDLFDWQGQPVSLAAGAQYRELRYAYQPDPLNAVGMGPRQIRDFPRAADQRAWAVFAESLIYFGERTELQLAARHERYDEAGGTTDPKVAMRFLALDWLSLRASWGTSFQAPSVFQVAGNTSARTLTDPFRFDARGVGSCTIDTSGEIINRGDNFSAVTILRGAGLQPQTAELANFGLLFQPKDNTALSVDFWTLDYRNVIAQRRSFQAIVDDDCRDDGQPNDTRTQRDSSGQLNIVTTDYENVGAVQSRGVDVNAHIDFESVAGDLRIRADATLLTRFDVDSAGEGFHDHLGTRNDTNGFAPTPELRFNFGLAWRRGAHAATLTFRHIDAYRNDEVAAQPKIAAWRTMDASYSYDLSHRFGHDTTVFVGARNLTDEDPPGLPTGREGIHRFNLRPGFDGSVHDVKGRTVYVRVRYSLQGRADRN